MLVTVDRLTQQRHLFDTLISQHFDFLQNVARRTTLLWASGHRHHAIRAKLVTSDHNSDKRLMRTRTHRRFAERIVTLKAVADCGSARFFPVKTDSQRAFTPRTRGFNQLRNFGQLTCTDHQINVRSTLKHQCLVFLCHTTQNTNHLIRTRLLAILETSECGVNLVLGVFSNTASIEQNCIGIARIVRQRVTLLPQCTHDQFAVQHIHLTADRLDE